MNAADIAVSILAALAFWCVFIFAVSSLRPVLLASFTSFILVVQQLILIGKRTTALLNDDWNPLNSIYDVLAILNFDLQLLKPGCGVELWSYVAFWWSTVILIIFTSIGLTIGAFIYALRQRNHVYTEYDILEYAYWQKRGKVSGDEEELENIELSELAKGHLHAKANGLINSISNKRNNNNKSIETANDHMFLRVKKEDEIGFEPPMKANFMSAIDAAASQYPDTIIAQNQTLFASNAANNEQQEQHDNDAQIIEPIPQIAIRASLSRSSLDSRSLSFSSRSSSSISHKHKPTTTVTATAAVANLPNQTTRTAGSVFPPLPAPPLPPLIPIAPQQDPLFASGGNPFSKRFAQLANPSVTPANPFSATNAIEFENDSKQVLQNSNSESVNIARNSNSKDIQSSPHDSNQDQIELVATINSNSNLKKVAPLPLSPIPMNKLKSNVVPASITLPQMPSLTFWALFKDRLFHSHLVLATLVYLRFTTSSVAMLYCTDVLIDNKMISVLQIDFNIHCYSSSEHIGIVWFVWCAVLLYSCCFPFLITYLILHDHITNIVKCLHKRTYSLSLSRFGAWFADLHYRHEWYKIIVMFIIFIYAFDGGFNKDLIGRLWVPACMFLLQLLITVWFFVYQHHNLYWLYLYTAAMLNVTIFAGLVHRFGIDHTLLDDSRYVIGISILFFIGLISLGFGYWRQRRLAILRLKQIAIIQARKELRLKLKEQEAIDAKRKEEEDAKQAIIDAENARLKSIEDAANAAAEAERLQAEARAAEEARIKAEAAAMAAAAAEAEAQERARIEAELIAKAAAEEEAKAELAAREAEERAKLAAEEAEAALQLKLKLELEAIESARAAEQLRIEQQSIDDAAAAAASAMSLIDSEPIIGLDPDHKNDGEELHVVTGLDGDHGQILRSASPISSARSSSASWSASLSNRGDRNAANLAQHLANDSDNEDWSDVETVIVDDERADKFAKVIDKGSSWATKQAHDDSEEEEELANDNVTVGGAWATKSGTEAESVDVNAVLPISKAISRGMHDHSVTSDKPKLLDNINKSTIAKPAAPFKLPLPPSLFKLPMKSTPGVGAVGGMNSLPLSAPAKIKPPPAKSTTTARWVASSLFGEDDEDLDLDNIEEIEKVVQKLTSPTKHNKPHQTKQAF